MHLGGKITTRSFSFFYNSMGCDRKKKYLEIDTKIRVNGCNSNNYSETQKD